MERKSQKAHERLDAAREKLPTKKVLKKERVFDEETGKGKTRLYFEDEMKVPKGQSKLQFEADKTVRKVGDTPVSYTHLDVYKRQIESTLEQMRASMETMGIGELLGLSIETLLISLCLKIMSILITVILYGRMIEIYCTVSIAPIPIATMSNREWGSIGTNYLKGLFALAFQGFLIMVCVAIYAVLINNMIIAANIHSALFSVAAYTVILCFSLFKTGSLAKSLFNAH